MSETAPLFLDLVAVIDEPSPNWCHYPYFLIAYWPRGRYWSIKAPLGFDDPAHSGIRAMIKELHGAGWQHIAVMRLPAGRHPWNAP